MMCSSGEAHSQTTWSTICANAYLAACCCCCLIHSCETIDHRSPNLGFYGLSLDLPPLSGSTKKSNMLQISCQLRPDPEGACLSCLFFIDSSRICTHMFTCDSGGGGPTVQCTDIKDDDPAWKVHILKVGEDPDSEQC